MSTAGAAPARPGPGTHEGVQGGSGSAAFPEQLHGELRGLGCHVRLEWVEAWLREHEAAMLSEQQQQQQRAREGVAQKCLGSILGSDLKCIGEAALPHAVAGLHETTIQGQVMLQADEIVDISAPTKFRYGALPTPSNPNQATAISGLQLPDEEDDSRLRGYPSGASAAHRCLKLSLTDGHQQVAGFEYRNVPALKVDLPAGTKVLVRNVAVRRGMLLLMPETVQVLGGQVAELEAARQRLLAHLASAKSRPPLSILIRNRQLPGRGSQSTEDFAQAASRAAWPQSGSEGPASRAEAGAHAPAANPRPPPQNQQEQQQQQQQGRQGYSQQRQHQPGAVHSVRAQQQSEAQLRHMQGRASNGIAERQPRREPSSRQGQAAAASGAGAGEVHQMHECAQDAAQDHPGARTQQHQAQSPLPQPDPGNDHHITQNRGSGTSLAMASELEVLDDDVLEQEWDRQMQALEEAERAQRERVVQRQDSRAGGRSKAQALPQVARGGDSLQHRGGAGERGSSALSPPRAEVPLVDLTELSQEPPQGTASLSSTMHRVQAAPAASLSGSRASARAAQRDTCAAATGEGGRSKTAVASHNGQAAQNTRSPQHGATEAHDLHTESRLSGAGAGRAGRSAEVVDREGQWGSGQAARGSSDGRNCPYSADNGPVAKRPRAEGLMHSSAAGAINGGNTGLSLRQPGAGGFKEVSGGRWPLLYLSDVTALPAGSPADKSDDILRVKCAVIGVKEFRHLRLRQLHLSVYLDDGVTVTPATIHPQEVERLMGLSKAQLDAAMGGMRKGSPAASAAGAAGASSSSGSRSPSSLGSPPDGLVRRSLQQMQTFLANFEGIADILRPSEAGAALTVVRLTQGCADLDPTSLAAQSKKSEE